MPNGATLAGLGCSGFLLFFFRGLRWEMMMSVTFPLNGIKRCRSSYGHTFDCSQCCKLDCYKFYVYVSDSAWKEIPMNP